MDTLHWTNRLSMALLPVASVATLMASILTGGAGTALASPEAKASPGGPIQDFNWLLDSSLLKDDDNSQGEDDSHHNPDAGDVIIERSRTTTTTTVTQVSYTDISTSYWATDFIYRLSSIDVVKGFPGGAFRPTAPLTKAQYAAMVARAFDFDPVRPVVAVPGLTQSYWAYQSIQTSYAMGFLDISDGNFNPDASLTRLDMLLNLARGLHITEVTSGRSVDDILSIFTDADTIPAEYRVIIAALVDRGIVVNYPDLTRLNLFAKITRDQACGFVYQSLVSLNRVQAIESAYIVNEANLTVWRSMQRETTIERTVDVERTGNVESNPSASQEQDRQNCNQGIGNGAEGCDPGNSHPHGGSNDEGGRTPGNR